MCLTCEKMNGYYEVHMKMVTLNIYSVLTIA